jgi:cell wall-associated NlpC family hydrolase
MRVKRDLFCDGTIAHSALEGQVTADRFVQGEMKRVTAPVARLCLTQGAPNTDREILYGHKVCQLDPFQSLCRDETTGYSGYVADRDLGGWAEPTHRVTARATLLFDEPDIKTPRPQTLSAGSLLRLIEVEDRFSRTHDGRYVPTHHLTEIGTAAPDLAATAELLLGTPYLWGGNSAFGIDCSGLVQLACQAAHIPCPGDSDQQMAELGAVAPSGSAPERNDLLFWKGHVAIVYDPETLIHANAGAMAVALEPLQTALIRIEAQGDGALLAHKRL